MAGDLEEKMAELGRAVLDETRVRLMMAYRFMDAALWHMDFVPASAGFPLATNGRQVLFVPSMVLQRYKHLPDELARDYLHCILHCVFRHPYDTRHEDLDAWWTAADITVESIAVQIAGEQYPSVNDGKRRQALTELQESIGDLSPNRVYNSIVRAKGDEAFREETGLDEDRVWDLRHLFERDDHSYWPAERSRDGEGGESSRAGNRKDGGRGHKTENDDYIDLPHGDREDQVVETGDMDDAPEGDGGARGGDDATGYPDANSTIGPGRENRPHQHDHDHEHEHDHAGKRPHDESDGGYSNTSAFGGYQSDIADSDAKAEEEWEDIGKQMEVDLDSFAQKWGDAAGDLAITLKMANKKTVDYRDFLRRFSKLMEEVKVNDDEFDYIYYELGFERYGNMPLIEPLEYQEVQRVRDFAIAIDTSASCSGELVQTFLSKTYEILKESEGFGRRVNVHIIQCDAEVQSDTKIESLDEMKRYGDDFEVRGFGGTDFRPVFAYLDELIERHEMENLQGLIYFTDGMGVYPTKMPAYDTAFVFVDEMPGLQRVPPWAMKVVVDEEEIREL